MLLHAALLSFKDTNSWRHETAIIALDKGFIDKGFLAMTKGFGSMFDV
jgi:hypothetical protein